MKYLIEFIRIKIVFKHQSFNLEKTNVYELGLRYLLDYNYIIYWENVYNNDEIEKKITQSKILNFTQKN